MYSVCLAPPPYRGGTHSRRAASFYVSPSIPPSLSLLPPSLGHHCSRSLEELKSIFCRSNRPRPPAHSRRRAMARPGAERGERVASCVYWEWRMIGEIERTEEGGRHQLFMRYALTTSWMGGWSVARRRAGQGEGIRDSSTCARRPGCSD